AFLLRHRPEVGKLEPDEQGWVSVEALRGALTRMLRFEVEEEVVRRVVDHGGIRRFEIAGDRIRAVREAPRRARTRGAARVTPPDILYHATTEPRMEEVRAAGLLDTGPERAVYLSDDESQAW